MLAQLRMFSQQHLIIFLCPFDNANAQSVIGAFEFLTATAICETERMEAKTQITSAQEIAGMVYNFVVY